MDRQINECVNCKNYDKYIGEHWLYPHDTWLCDQCRVNNDILHMRIGDIAENIIEDEWV